LQQVCEELLHAKCADSPHELVQTIIHVLTADKSACGCVGSSCFN
jgi:hypothetical protein